MPFLELKGVEKQFGEVKTIKGIDLAIEQGQFTVFVGPSGCGKSTLLRLIAGLETLNAGSIHLDGRDITRLPSAQRDLAMVFQSYALYPHMTVAENMSFALRLAKADPAVIKKKVDRAAEILNLGPYLKRLPREMSGGQRQRVAIGRAIVREPKVFLFDEPLSNLDAALRGQTRVEIAKLHRELGATTLGFSYAREWPDSWPGPADIDSGPIIPGFKISAGSSGMAFIGASAFGDAPFLAMLNSTIDFSGFPSRKQGGLKYCASNQVGDAALLYAATLGPVLQKVIAGHHP